MAKERFYIYLKKNYKPDKNKDHVTTETLGAHHSINVINEGERIESTCKLYVDRSFIAKLSKNYLMRLLNECINHCMLHDTLMTPVTEDEANYVIKGKPWLRVCKGSGRVVGVERGRKDIKMTYICLDMEHKKYVKVTEFMSALSSKSLKDIEDDILKYKHSYINTKIEDYGKYCEGYIATVDTPVTEKLVLKGFRILSEKIDNTINSPDDYEREEEPEDKYKYVNEKKALKQLFDANMLGMSQELDMGYTSKSYKEILTVYLDGQITELKINRFLEKRTDKKNDKLEIPIDGKEHVLDLSIGDFNKKIVIPPGITNEREISVQLRD